MLIREPGLRLLTDPLLTDRVVHLSRRRGVAPVDVEADVVLVSHLHHDHCHLPSLARLAPGTRVLLPRGGAGLLTGLPLDPVEMVPGDVVNLGAVEVAAVHAFHDGRRHPGSRWAGPALGYVVHGRHRVWFAGDTGWTDRLGRDVGEVDVALLPVGGWGPVARPSVQGQHLDPEQAARIVATLPIARAVPVHYGTLWPTGLPAGRHRAFLGPGLVFRDAAGRLAPDVTVDVLDPGQSLP